MKIHFVHKPTPLDPRVPSGGAEGNLIGLARCLARQGHEVRIWGQLSCPEGLYDGIHYANAGEADASRGLFDSDVVCATNFTRLRFWIEKNQKPRLFLLGFDESLLALGVLQMAELSLLDGIIAVSEAQRRRFLQEGAPEDKVIVVRLGYDAGVFYPDARVPRRAHQLMFAGALIPWKGLQLLSKALPLVKKEFPDLELHVYGSARLWGLEESRDNPALWDPDKTGIVFHGLVDAPTLAQAFRSAQLCVVPSLLARPDPFPTVSLQSQACGCPVVVSRSGGLPETIEEGRTGQTYHPNTPEMLAATLTELLCQPGKLREMEVEATAWVKDHFTFEQSAQVLEGLFRSWPHETTLPKTRKKKVLVVAWTFPRHDRIGGEFRFLHVLKYLTSRYDVRFLTLEPYDSQDLSHERYLSDWAYGDLIWLDGLSHLERTLKEGVDLIFFESFAPIDPCMPILESWFGRKDRPAIVIDSVEPISVRLKRESELDANCRQEDCRAWKCRELAAFRMADMVLAISEADKEIFSAWDSNVRVCVVSNVLAPAKAGSREQRRPALVYLGYYGSGPNVNSVYWFVRNIWPKVRQALPQLEFWILGADPPPAMVAMEGNGIHVTGQVPDLAPYLSSALAMVVPMTFGAGLKTKINWAFAYGLPVVTTAIGNEGFNLRHEEEALVAEGVDDFAACVIRLCQDAALWNKLAASSTHRASAYSPDELVRSLDRALGEAETVPILPRDVASYHALMNSSGGSLVCWILGRRQRLNEQRLGQGGRVRFGYLALRKFYSLVYLLSSGISSLGV